MNNEALNYFFKGYFHQDWFSEYGTFENAVRDFCENENESKVTLVKRALNELIEDGNITEQIILDHGGYVRPEAFELTTTNWLKKVVEIMNP